MVPSAAWVAVVRATMAEAIPVQPCLVVAAARAETMVLAVLVVPALFILPMKPRPFPNPPPSAYSVSAAACCCYAVGGVRKFLIRVSIVF